ncbi:MAG TPA: gamma-glutamyltransferase [Burkholderiales bacterium]|nr:gamma-glutamyltransferase [Burkholderiales bacterium]
MDKSVLVRPPTLAPKAMVCCPHALASAAGVDVLRSGGSAVDAAIAASAALSVLYPHMTGIGGDAFWLIHEAGSRKVKYLAGGGRASRNGGLGWFEAHGLREIPLTGVLPATLTVPGSVDSWCAAHAAYARLPLRRILAQAIDYARDGFPVTERVAGAIETGRAANVFNAAAKSIFLPEGRSPRAGERLVNRGLAGVLERIGDAGRDGFYAGETARELAAFAREEGGFFDESDFDRQRAQWGEPIRGTYRGVEIFETPAPTQGFTVLEMLNLIEPFATAKMDPLGPDLAHLLVQAKQIAFCDRDALLADPDFAPVPIERLISKGYAAKRRALISPERALAWDRVPSYGSLAGDTVYVCVVDAEGNAVSLIQSLYSLFGSGVVAGATGVLLQNRSAYFSLDPAHPNRLQAGKRPLHTLIASMAFADGKLRHVFGCMGADGQPQIHLQGYVGMLDFGRDVQEAIDAPRWLSGRFGIGEPRDLLNIEGRFPAATVAELERRGHQVNRWPDWMEKAGHAHGISIDPKNGMRIGGADPRSDGTAIGY